MGVYFVLISGFILILIVTRLFKANEKDRYGHHPGLHPGSAKAQDAFSQFGAAPMLLNPALSGLSSCTYRAALNYRNQWASIVGPSSYQTYAGSFDIGLFRQAFNYSMLGLGLMVFNDVSGDGALTNLTMMGSLAYHQNMGGRGAHYLCRYSGRTGAEKAWIIPTSFSKV